MFARAEKTSGQGQARKSFRDFPGYLELLKKRDEIGNQQEPARREEAAAQKALVDGHQHAQGLGGNERSRAIQRAAEVLVGTGEEIPEVVAVQSAQARHTAAVEQRTVLERAYELVNDQLAAFRRKHEGELLEGWKPEIRSLQRKEVEAVFALSRVGDERRRLAAALVREGIELGGDFASMAILDVGSLGDPYSVARRVFQDATMAGVDVPDAPEITAAGKVQRAEQERIRKIDAARGPSRVPVGRQDP